MASYAFGAIWNKRIQRSFWRALSRELRRFSRRVSYKSFGTSGFKVAFTCPSGPLTKIEIALVLLARELILYLPAAYLTGRRDRMIVKANVRRKPDFYMEVFGKRTRLAKQIELRAGKFKPVDAGGLSRFMKVLSTDPAKASKLLSMGLLERLVAVRGCLERFSISRNEPHLLIVCKRDEGAISAILELLSEAGKLLSELAPSEREPSTRGRRGRRR